MNEEQAKKQHDLFKQRMEECGNDYLEYVRKYNRHTLSISLINEQTGTEVWEGSSVTFFNEDNAISHLGFLNELLEELTKENNRDWGTIRSNEILVERLTTFVREKVESPVCRYERKEEELEAKGLAEEIANHAEGFKNKSRIPLTKLVEELLDEKGREEPEEPNCEKN